MTAELNTAKILIVGSGNLAKHLLYNLDSDFFVSVYCRTFSSFQFLKNDFPNLKHEESINSLSVNYDYVFLAISDSAIEEVSNSLPLSNSIIVHCSGATSIEVLNKHTNYAVMYPLQTLNKSTLERFENIPLLLEASNENVNNQMCSLAERLSKVVVSCNSENRLKYHLAAVFSNNFCNHLVYIAQQFLLENGLDKSLLSSLLIKTFENMIHNNPFDAQTGPARRNDEITMHKHLQIIQSEYLKQLYKIISKSITEAYNK